MPELPEVETIRRGLENNILNKQIRAVKVKWPGAIKTGSKKFVKILVGNKIKKIDRVGKLLIFELVGQKFVLVHLKMTGQLIYCSKEKCIAGGHKLSEADLQVPNEYTWVTIEFSNGSALYFNDMRKFGYLKLVDESEKEFIKKQFGIEPLQLNYTLKNFQNIFKGRRTNIKAVLLNQKLVAGIGNIYVDEICLWIICVREIFQ